MKEFKNKIKKKSALVMVAFLVIIFCVFAGASGLTRNITTLINSKIISAFNTQDYLEINRDNTPKINVTINDSHTLASIEITNFPSGATSKQYSIDGANTWQDYIGEFTVKENTTIQTRYKNGSDENYTIGSSKVIVDLNYNIELKAPTITLKEGSTTIAQSKVATQSVVVNLSTTDTQDKTVVYEVSVTRYPLNQSGLINSDGTINIENVKKAGNEASYDRLETKDDYTKIDESSLRLEKSGIYKIKVKATTNGGFVKSEETVGVTAINKVDPTGLLTFKTQDGNTYEIDTWTEKNVIVTLNTNGDPDNDIAFGNKNITYILSGATEQEETTIKSGTIATITNEGTTTVTLKIKIGAIAISTDYKVKIDKTAPSAPAITVASGTAGSNGWYTSNVTLKLTSSDAKTGVNETSGVKNVIYSINNGTETTLANGGTVSLTSEGTYTITCYSYDNFGYKSAVSTKTIKIDKTAPVVTFTKTLYNKSGTQISESTANGYGYSATVTVNVSETGTSQIASTSYGWNQSSTTEPTYSSTQSQVPTSTGTHYLWVKAVDNAGNTTIKNQEVKIDRTAPTAATLKMVKQSTDGTVTTTTYSNDTWVNTYIYTTMEGGSDNQSGFESNSMTVTGASSNGTYTATSRSIQAQGISYIVLTTTDKVGNSSTSATYTLKMDRTKPTASVSGISSSCCATDEVAGNLEDTLSGIVAYAWTSSNSTPSTWSTISNISSTTISKSYSSNSTYYLHVKDAAGNTANESFTITHAGYSSHNYTGDLVKGSSLSGSSYSFDYHYQKCSRCYSYGNKKSHSFDHYSYVNSGYNGHVRISVCECDYGYASTTVAHKCSTCGASYGSSNFNHGGTHKCACGMTWTK